MSWSWRYLDADGSAVQPDPAPADDAFPSQGDAESWLGEHWRDLLTGGVEAVSLVEGEREVYGPMSLRPVED